MIISRVDDFIRHDFRRFVPTQLATALRRRRRTPI